MIVVKMLDHISASLHAIVMLSSGNAICMHQALLKLTRVCVFFWKHDVSTESDSQ